MKNDIYEEQLKKLLFITTRNVPDFNTDGDYFYYFLNLLELRKRFDTIKKYFETESKMDINEYLEYRETIKNKIEKEYKDISPKKALAGYKYTYPREMTYMRIDRFDKTNIVLDLKCAYYQACGLCGLYKESTWIEHFRNFTDNTFMLNYDEKLLYDCYSKEDGITPPFTMAYFQLMYNAIIGGVDEYMKTFGCKRIRTTTDALWYEAPNQDEVNKFKNDWRKEDVKTFNGTNLHYRILDEKNRRYRVKETGEEMNMVIFEEQDYRTVFQPIFNDKFYPQIKKLVNGKNVTEMDKHYLKGIVSPELIMIP